MPHSKGKPVGKTRDTSYQVGARKTITVKGEKAWDYLTAGEGIRVWLGEIAADRLSKGTTYRLPDGTAGELRVFSDSHLRMSWHPPGWERASTLQLRVIPKGDRSVIAFHQENLPGPAAREERRLFFTEILEELNQRMSEW